MTDDRMDLLIRRLDVEGDPEPVFVETSLARLLPAVRDARRLDASWIGRLMSSVRWDLPRPGSTGRTISIPLAVAVVVALLLATIGLTIVGSGLPFRSPVVPPAITYVGSFEPVDLGSDGAFRGVAIGGGRVLFHVFAPDKTIRVWDSGDGTVRKAGMLLIARSDPAFVLLRDGRVLVVGGDTTAPDTGAGWRAAPATAEVFDPVSGASQAVGTLVAPRTAFSTALLPDGRVLISGGYDPTRLEDNGNVESGATAEIFDPATGTFRATGSMGVARNAHTSVAMPDGRILVWGGTTRLGSPETPPEIFYPAAGVFSPATPMGEISSGVAAVVVVDGRLVVVHGGCDHEDGRAPSGHQLADAGFYDPASGTYEAAGQLPNCVDTATALPNGDVLVTGFWWDSAANHSDSAGSFRANGAEQLIGWSALFDPETGAVRETAPILNRGIGQTILLPDGRVLSLDGLGAANVFH